MIRTDGQGSGSLILYIIKNRYEHHTSKRYSHMYYFEDGGRDSCGHIDAKKKKKSYIGVQMTRDLVTERQSAGTIFVVITLLTYILL